MAVSCNRPLKKYCGTRLRRCCDTHSNAYLFDRSRRCVSRALHPGVLATFFNGLVMKRARSAAIA